MSTKLDKALKAHRDAEARLESQKQETAALRTELAELRASASAKVLEGTAEPRELGLEIAQLEAAICVSQDVEADCAGKIGEAEMGVREAEIEQWQERAEKLKAKLEKHGEVVRRLMEKIWQAEGVKSVALFETSGDPPSKSALLKAELGHALKQVARLKAGKPALPFDEKQDIPPFLTPLDFQRLQETMPPLKVSGLGMPALDPSAELEVRYASPGPGGGGSDPGVPRSGHAVPAKQR